MVGTRPERGKEISDQVDQLPADPASLEAINRKYAMMTFWSAVDDVIDLTQAASDDALPDVVVSGLPVGYTIVRVRLTLKVRAIQNTSAGGANAINGACNIRVKKAAGTWGVDDIAALGLVNNLWTIAASTREGGDVILGSVDVKSEVDEEATYNLRIEDCAVDYDNLRLNDVQVGLEVTFY